MQLTLYFPQLLCFCLVNVLTWCAKASPTVGETVGSVGQQGLSGAVAASIPHVTNCNFCFDCLLERPPGGANPPSQHSDGIISSRRLAEWQASEGFRSSLRRRHAQRRHAGRLPSESKRIIPSLASLHDERMEQHRVLHQTMQKDKRTPRPSAKPERNVDLPPHLDPFNYMPTAQDVIPKQRLSNCTVCWGCRTKLTPMANATTLFGRTYASEMGATSSFIYKTTTNRTASGKAVVKVYCVPVRKLINGKTPTCNPRTTVRIITLLLAIDRIREDCGFADLLPRLWVEPVDAVLPDGPGKGYHIRWYGVWMEYMHGISFENYLNKGLPRKATPLEVIKMMHSQLNTTQVVMAAIFDLLTSQCDRHAQNIFLMEDGNLRLIDNEAALMNTWKLCGFDSVFVPTTQKQEIVRLTNAVVLKMIPAADVPVERINPQLLLDYRCYVEGGKLGTSYPQPIKQCMARMTQMTVPELQQHYQLPDNYTANLLQERAKDMLLRGYEWAAKYGAPTNLPAKRYRFQPPCCKLKMIRNNQYMCGHDWPISLELPIGNPINGREWVKPFKDPGSYEGGTHVDDDRYKTV